MARDTALLDAVQGQAIAARVYGWDGAWVSLGRFQRADTSLLADAPVQWVERPTGGRGVLHGHDVTVGLAFALTTLLPPSEWRSIRAVYRAAIGPVVSALRECGIDAALGEAERVRGSARSPDCFAALSANDVIDLASGQKVCGCALRLTDTAVLAQCSIPSGAPIVDPARVYVNAAPAHWISLGHEDFAQSLAAVLAR